MSIIDDFGSVAIGAIAGAIGFIVELTLGWLIHPLGSVLGYFVTIIDMIWFLGTFLGIIINYLTVLLPSDWIVVIGAGVGIIVLLSIISYIPGFGKWLRGGDSK